MPKELTPEERHAEVDRLCNEIEDFIRNKPADALLEPKKVPPRPRFKKPTSKAGLVHK